MNSVRNSDSEHCPESRMGWVHKVHTQRTLAARTLRPGHAQSAMSQASSALSRTRPAVLGRALPCRAPFLARPGLRACSTCCVPTQAAVCLLRLLCACLGCCVFAQPTVCLLSLLCAIIQLSLLCACSAYCVPQYS